MSTIDILWPFIASQESNKLSLDPDDRGNWTSGICGIGELRGSQYGISAAAFPLIDIKTMTFEGAKGICKTHYWDLLKCDLLPPPIAVMLCDAAWGSGPIPAVKTLQAVVGSPGDGVLGDGTRKTLQALCARPVSYLSASGIDGVLAEFAAERILFESAAGTWDKYKGGWVRRITRSLMLARSLA